MEGEKLLTVSEVAERLRVSEFTVRRWLNNREIVGYKFGSEWRVKQSDLEEYIERHRAQGGE